MSLSPAWFAEWAPGQPGLYTETLSNHHHQEQQQIEFKDTKRLIVANYVIFRSQRYQEVLTLIGSLMPF